MKAHRNSPSQPLLSGSLMFAVILKADGTVKKVLMRWGPLGNSMRLSDGKGFQPDVAAPPQP